MGSRFLWSWLPLLGMYLSLEWLMPELSFWQWIILMVVMVFMNLVGYLEGYLRRGNQERVDA